MNANFCNWLDFRGRKQTWKSKRGGVTDGDCERYLVRPKLKTYELHRFVYFQIKLLMDGKRVHDPKNSEEIGIGPSEKAVLATAAFLRDRKKTCSQLPLMMRTGSMLIFETSFS